ncbi:immunity protein Imm33 domain-containing protein [Mycobacterium branderi]|uniref:Imm33-like domain-containing protein n=1 Tax=Mycobacterium branderi TaxID=43348 RepID=A0A7I7W7M5_9MYCO|nr:hypothetical protein [Mycobacterium branderi]MCV7231525.1 hypothetical protein [Mycobacterium branderi]ORA37399.1 hypothetical protein BST20_13145 [Mycobacterium branderi]BBZ13589.1 hypothetical protein MBRA_37840 [Mycobacterium branderi]
MAQRRTTAGASGHPEFTLEYEPGIVTELGIEWLASWLQDCISSGTRFSVGQTIAIGWMNCYVTDRGDGTLGLSEPDFTNIPPNLVAGASNTVSQLWYQREIADSVGLVAELDFPRYDQYAMTCERLVSADPILMHRYTHEEDESGWYIGCSGDDHDHDETKLHHVSLYELAVAKPAIIGFLALPPDCSVLVGGGAPLVVRHREPLPVREGSLLATMFGDEVVADQQAAPHVKDCT